MSDTEGAEEDNETGESKLVPFAKPNPFDSNGYAALMLRMDAALERSRASLAEFKEIVAIIKRDYTAR
jgi:hypothetical protein